MGEARLGDGELPMAVEVCDYQKTVAEYSKMYGKSERTIKGWKKIGKEAGVRPPLDDPGKFRDWWATHMKHRVPSWLDAIAGERAASEVEGEEKKPEVEQLESVDFDSLDGVGDMGLDTMRKVVALKSIQVADAYKEGNSSKIQSAERALRDATATLRQIEKTRADLLKGAGELLERSQVRNTLQPMLAKLGDGFLEAMIRVAQTVNPELTREAARGLCVRERDACFRVVKGDLVGDAA